MPGTNPVGTFAISDYNTDAGTTYTVKIDSNSMVMARVADAFAPHPTSPASMTVDIDAGFLSEVGPSGLQSVIEVVAQTVTIGAAPSSPNNRIDLIVVSDATGAASVIAGTPASSPAAPAITAGLKTIAQVSVPNGTTAIASTNITDLRAIWHSLVPGIKWAVASGAADVITAAYTPANAALTDGLILGFRASAANATTTPTFNPDALGAKTITKKGGAPLLAGDVPGALAECLVRYDAANTRWELLLPANSAAPWGIAGGTSDAITAAYTPPNAALYDGLFLGFRAGAANATTTPSFNPDGLGAKTITKKGGAPLLAGDIPGALAECLVRYNAANTRWELLNPIAPSGPILLATLTAANSAALTDTAHLTSGFKSYEFRLIDLLPAVNNSDLYVRYSTNGGSSYDAGASSYAYTSTCGDTGGANANSSLAATSQIPLDFAGDGISNNATYNGLAGIFRLFNPAASGTYKKATFETAYFGDSTTYFFNVSGSGIYVGNTLSINAIQFLMSSGNIVSGQIEIWGYP